MFNLNWMCGSCFSSIRAGGLGNQHMPIDYYCEGCGLTFATGIYGVRGRYAGRQLLVCRSCGTVHEYQRSFRNERPSRLMALPEPVILLRKPERPTFLDKRLKWTECVIPPGLEVSTTDGELDLRELACFGCATTGTLASEWKRDEGCPRCGAGQLVECGGWIT
jgi:hypothetical protein